MAVGRTTAEHTTQPARGGGDGRRQVNVPVLGRVTVPPPEQLAFYGVLAALGALEIVEWPVVLIVGAGHALSRQHRSRTLQQAGEAAQSA
ncbi:hypothetical protein AB0L05_32100 [Nonomuraea pusilla]|uniref:hypothetical protein n=1 Tax=Nonomuraea pusilla TaxID=46177 RepID=UPI0033301612